MYCVRRLQFIVNTGIGQVSHCQCQAQPVVSASNKGHPRTSSCHAHLCTSLQLVKLKDYAKFEWN